MEGRQGGRGTQEGSLQRTGAVCLCWGEAGGGRVDKVTMNSHQGKVHSLTTNGTLEEDWTALTQMASDINPKPAR